MALFVFIVVMLVIAASVALPLAWMGGDPRREPNALAIGAAVLGGGGGAVGFGLVVFFQATEGFESSTVQLLAYTSLLPVVAAPIGLHAALRSRPRAARRALLTLAAALTLAGTPVLFVFSIGGLTALVSGLCYLAATGNPRELIRKLDPRLPRS